MKRITAVLMTLVAVFGFGSISFADDIDDLKKEMKKLQTQINELSKAREDRARVNGGEAGEGGLAVGYVGRYEGPFKKGGLIIGNPSGFGNVSVGGYMDVEYDNFVNAGSRFRQHRWILNIGATLAERLMFFSEYEIEYGGPDAADAGEAKVEQAWLDYLISDPINVRMGAILVPFGRYNIYHDSDLQDLTDRPLVARRVIPTTWTEAGIGIHGTFNPTIGGNEDVELGYELYIINGLGDGFSDKGLRGARGSMKADDNNSKAVVARLLISPKLGHEIGISTYTGKYNNDDSITGIGLDWLSVWGPLEVVGEYASFTVDEPAGVDLAETFQGYYIQTNYHFWPEGLNNSFLGRGFDDPTFTLVGRYGSAKIDDDDDADTADNEETRFTLGFNYRPVESWVLKLEHQWNDTDNETLERGDNNGFMASMAMGF